ncbi:MAG TPA: hypothetical protein VFZ64_10530 [Nocardioidaceae bacterium]
MKVSERVAAPGRVHGAKPAAISAAVTAALNVLLLWLGNRAMLPAPLASVVLDVVITSLLVGWLCALFAAHRPRRRAALFGLGVGAAAAALSVAAFFLLGMLGVTGLSFGAFAVFKAVYTGLLAFMVTRWVILRRPEVGRRE